MIANEIDLKVGQVVKTMGGQITVPNWLERWMSGNPSAFIRVGDMPVIKLKGGLSRMDIYSGTEHSDEKWDINTNGYNQSGLVCFVSEKYLRMAILSVKIIKVMNKSVFAEPIEWIEVNPRLDVDSIGRKAQKIFDEYLEKVQERLEGRKGFDEQDTSSLDWRVIWHNKEK